LREDEQPGPAEIGGDLDDAGFQRGLFFIGRFQAFDCVVKTFGSVGDDKGRSAPCVFLPDAGSCRRNGFP